MRFHDNITLLCSDGEIADTAECFLRRGGKSFYDLGAVCIIRKRPQTPEAARRGKGLAPVIGITRPLVEARIGLAVDQVRRPRAQHPSTLVYAHRGRDDVAEKMAKISWIWTMAPPCASAASRSSAGGARMRRPPSGASGRRRPAAGGRTRPLQAARRGRRSRWRRSCSAAACPAFGCAAGVWRVCLEAHAPTLRACAGTAIKRASS